jgi:hypothetical protein
MERIVIENMNKENVIRTKISVEREIKDGKALDVNVSTVASSSRSFVSGREATTITTRRKIVMRECIGGGACVRYSFSFSITTLIPPQVLGSFKCVIFKEFPSKHIHRTRKHVRSRQSALTLICL